jgi:hypothetical protein
MGYVPHPRGYQEGGYEATYSSAYLAPETPILWCDAAIKMLKDLKGEELEIKKSKFFTFCNGMQ